MSKSGIYDEFVGKALAIIRRSLDAEFVEIGDFESARQKDPVFVSENGHVELYSNDDCAFTKVVFHVQSDILDLTLVGTISPDGGGWGQKLLSSTANLLEKEVLLARCERSLEEYSAQVSRDFEELVWMRDLALHLQQSDIRVPLSEVVQQVFPALLDTIQASQIVVVQYARPIGSNASIPSVEETQLQTFGDGFIGVQSAQKILSQYGVDARGKIIVNNLADRLDLRELSSFILLPIANHDSEFGWILAANRSHDRRSIGEQLGDTRSELHQDEFGTFEAGVLQSTAIALATQAKNTFFHGEEEELLIGIVRALINAVDAKDRDTRGHSDRVARVSRRLAQQLGFDDQECEKIYLSGLLHDIGKIGVSDKVLLKRGSLTDDEYEQLKQHPVIGYNVLKHLERVSYVLPGVLYHHESYDGRGYPEGLVADEIPIIARIIAVADAFDAMTSDRPYRRGMPVSEAEATLKENKGPQWDRDIIDAFFEATDDIYEICFTSAKNNGQPQKRKADFDFITNAVGATH